MNKLRSVCCHSSNLHCLLLSPKCMESKLFLIHGCIYLRGVKIYTFFLKKKTLMTKIKLIIDE